MEIAGLSIWIHRSQTKILRQLKNKKPIIIILKETIFKIHSNFPKMFGKFKRILKNCELKLQQLRRIIQIIIEKLTEIAP